MGRSDEFSYGGGELGAPDVATGKPLKACPDCGGLGVDGYASTIRNEQGKWGKDVFLHRGSRREGYASYTEHCQPKE